MSSIGQILMKIKHKMKWMVKVAETGNLLEA